MHSAYTPHFTTNHEIVKFYGWKERTDTKLLTQKWPLEVTHSFIQQIFIKGLLSARHHCARHQGYSHENYRHVSCFVWFTGERTRNHKLEIYLRNIKNRKAVF